MKSMLIARLRVKYLANAPHLGAVTAHGSGSIQRPLRSAAKATNLSGDHDGHPRIKEMKVRQAYRTLS